MEKRYITTSCVIGMTPCEHGHANLFLPCCLNVCFSDLFITFPSVNNGLSLQAGTTQSNRVNMDNRAFHVDTVTVAHTAPGNFSNEMDQVNSLMIYI